MKKLYLVDTNGTREFWTVDDENMILRALYSNESVDAENCDDVEDDSSWDEVDLTAGELKHLFDNVDIIDERPFDNRYCVVVEIGEYNRVFEDGRERLTDTGEYHKQDEKFFVNYENAVGFFDSVDLNHYNLEASRWDYQRGGRYRTRREEFVCKTIWRMEYGEIAFGCERYEELKYRE